MRLCDVRLRAFRREAFARAEGRLTWISVASISGRARLVVRVLGVVAVVGLAVFVIALAGGPGDARSDGYKCLDVALYLMPAALCLLRGLLVRDQQLPWIACGIGMSCFAAGYGYYHFVLPSQHSPDYPSLGDALLLCYYIASLVGVVALLHVGLSHFRRRVWIDAAVGGLAIAAISAAVLVDPVLTDTGGSAAAMATSMAYPFLDVIIVAVLLGVFANSAWHPGRVWAMLGAAWGFQAVIDIVYRFQESAGTYQFGTLLDASWPALMLLIAFAAWQRPTVREHVWVPNWATLGVTIAFALVGLILMIVDHWRPVDDTAVVLATLALLAAFVRTTLSFGDLKTAARSRGLLLRNELILNAAGEGIFGIDGGGAVTFANPAAMRVTGYTPEEFTGHSLHGLVLHSRADGAVYPPAECPMLASLVDGAVHRCDDDVYWRSDGTSFPVEYTSTPIVDGERISGAVVVFRDVTERREIERVKDQFTSVVSHELRTPLTSIRGSLGLLESGVLGPLPERGQRMVQIAVQNTDRLVRLINDILDLERIDSGTIHLRRESCDAGELIARAVEALQPVADAAGVELVIDAAPTRFTADPDYLIQTLTNLISNAVKFSPAGTTVKISGRLREQEILFAVSDHGRGIPLERLETIFERFQQVDASDSRQHGGTGLGLAICRSIVEHHDGKIWARSTPGQGSTLTFTVPALEHTDSYTPQPGLEHAPAVLVCDDDPGIVEVMAAALQQHGYRVIPARSGEVAIQRAITEHPGVILLDLMMPGMNGAETVAALREHPETVDIPIVILSVLPRSASVIPDGAIVDWIEKPAADAVLFAALERAIESRKAIHAGAAS